MKARGALVIASYGFTPAQLTIESAAALRQCDRILCLAANESTRRMLGEFGLKVESCSGGNEGLRAKALAALRASKRVGLLTYGDPLFRNHDSLLLIQACEKEGFSCEVYHAVSSLGILLGRLPLGSLDPEGVYLGTPSSFQRLDPDVPALVFSIGHQSARADHARFAAAVRRKYPAGHRVELVRFSFRPSLELTRKTYDVSEISRALKDADDATTLYLPRVSRPGRRR